MHKDCPYTISHDGGLQIDFVHIEYQSDRVTLVTIRVDELFVLGGTCNSGSDGLGTSIWLSSRENPNRTTLVHLTGLDGWKWFSVDADNKSIIHACLVKGLQ